MKEETILLKDLQDLLLNKQKYKQNTEIGHYGVGDSGEGNQGDYNEKFIFYKHPGLPEGVFMKETWQSDSYGCNEAITQIEFVKGKEKTITVLEPV